MCRPVSVSPGVLRSAPVELDQANLSWEQIRALAVQAVDATLVRLARDGSGDELADEPVALRRDGGPLEIWTTITRRWVDQQFYAVAAECGDGQPPDRHSLEFRGFAGRKLQLVVPPASRAALDGARKVRVFCLSGFEIRLKRALRDKLVAATRGDLVEQLWRGGPVDVKGWSPPWLAPDQPLNVDQQRALGAMTGPGAFFVWGPPGTGKTKVITAAVRDAIAHGRSVLIASHTHVAVDNVLEGLITPADLPALPRPGIAIRVASSQTEDKVSSAVRAHAFLLVDNAAAVMTDHVVRHAALTRRRQENRDHSVRSALVKCIEATAQADVDGVRAARRAVGASSEIEILEHTRVKLEAELAADWRT